MWLDAMLSSLNGISAFYWFYGKLLWVHFVTILNVLLSRNTSSIDPNATQLAPNNLGN